VRRLRSGPALAVLAVVTALAGGCGAPPGPAPLAEVVGGAPVVDPSARAGGLVAGFPAVVPVPAGDPVTASAVQARGALLAVSVTGTSTRTAPALLAWFRARLATEGFTATDGSLLPAGAVGAAFGRPGGVELLLVAVVDRGSRRSWSVGGTVAPPAGNG